MVLGQIWSMAVLPLAFLLGECWQPVRQCMRALLFKKEKQMASGQFGIMHTMLNTPLFCILSEQGGATTVGNIQLKVSNYRRGF